MTKNSNKQQLNNLINTLGSAGNLGAPPGSLPWAIAVKLELQAALHNIAFNEKQLKAWADLMKEKAGYLQLVDDCGQPFKSYEDFCTAKPPFGLGCIPSAESTSTLNESKKITIEEKDAAETEIYSQRLKISHYDTKEFPLEEVVEKCLEGYETKTNGLIFGKNTSNKIWTEAQRSNFVESIILGLPLNPIWLSEIRDENDTECLQVIDGIQRLRTIIKFVADELILSDLKILTCLNGFKFSGLPAPRQWRFNRTTLRVIVFSKKATEETCKDLRMRINN